jgi:hypothetical protein
MQIIATDHEGGCEATREDQMFKINLNPGAATAGMK